VVAPFFAQAHVLQRAVSCLIASANPGPDKLKLSAVLAGWRASQILVPLKLLALAADTFVVRRPALITGLSLALGAAALTGAGEWAAGRFDASPAGPGAPPPATAGTYDGSRVAAVSPPPALPPTSNYLPASTPGYTLRSDVQEVRLQFTVADEQGRLVQNLSADDVRVLDDQSPVPRFNAFERGDNLPLRLGLILDTSDSVRRVLAEQKAAAVNFLDQVMRPQTDTAFVMAFGGDVHVWQAATADREQLAQAVVRAKQPGWGTSFYDALYSACANQLANANDGGLVHRAIVVLSDGDDTQSLHNLADVVRIAERNEIQIYALTLHSRKMPARGDQNLQRLADATGGRLYVAESSNDFAGAFAQIEQDLRAQYFVSFPPQQSNPGFHSLQVEVRAPQKLQIHARQGYYAMAQ
jgi:Ca-activated chloride channel homolog